MSRTRDLYCERLNAALFHEIIQSWISTS